MFPSPSKALTTATWCRLQIGKVNAAPHSFIGGS